MGSLYSWFNSIFWASYIYIFQFKIYESGVCPFSKKLNFCLNNNLEKVPFCTLEKIEDSNQKPYFILEKLLHEPFFRYFKVFFAFNIFLSFRSI